VGKKSQEETILKTNLEAADVVVDQLRLRNIGGIIVVDFIDMARESSRKRVSDALAQALKRDRARAATLKISELGLVQMTRKRTRESLEQMLTQQCPQCEGRRVVRSVPTLAADVLRAIRREVSRRPGVDMLLVRLNPEIASYLYDVGSEGLESLERQLSVKIVLKSKLDLDLAAFEFENAPAAA
jgi:ribonuclease G